MPQLDQAIDGHPHPAAATTTLPDPVARILAEHEAAIERITRRTLRRLAAHRASVAAPGPARSPEAWPPARADSHPRG